jgi:cytidylate kinase
MRFLQAATILLQSTVSLLRLPPTAKAFVLSPTKQVQLLHTRSAIINRQKNYRFVSPPRIIGIVTPTSKSASTTTTHLLATSPKSYFSSLENFSKMPDLTYPLLAAQNVTTTNTIINHYATSEQFAALSTFEGSAILKRDTEDGEKLQKGIDIAKAKGVIDPNYVPEEYVSVDVLGKSPEEVADEILATIRSSDSAKGGVVVLCGLSGTGKGTTVATLQHKLETEDGKRVVCWSNGNIFRSVTLLAATWCEQHPEECGGDITKALTKENLASFVNMLSFGKFKDGEYDTRICGMGLDYLVSEVKNTDLMAPKVVKNIPTVAEVTQGEVILFAAEAVRKMGEDGIFVLLEGREQTVNYVKTPLKFTLTLSDMSLIGKRRAAQRLAAGALDEVKEGASVKEIETALDGQLAKMLKEANA